MPFTKDGVQPDIIMSPNAVPSRMTIGQLLECLLGKVSALKGHISDATPFNEYDIDQLSDILKDYGFDEHGYEDLYCGMTGKKIKSKIFIGPTFYMRLKHLVQDKIHSRARGPTQVLTRQPPEGTWDCRYLNIKYRQRALVNTKYWLVYRYVGNISKLRG